MGEPLPGDFPDPINVKTASVLLKDAQIGSAGDYLRYNTSGTKAWEVVDTTLITFDGATIVGEGLVQSQQDFDSTGEGDAVANVGAFGPGSWFYGLANGTINPNDYVTLTRVGTQFGFENIRKIEMTAASVTTNVLTVSTATPHHLKVGDSVTIQGTDVTAFNTTVIVASITDEDTFTADLTTGDDTATTFGTVDAKVTGGFAHAQFIKKSGATYSDGAVLNDVGVFSMLKGGQST